MPRPKNAIPSLCFHQQSGQFCAYINRQRKLLGTNEADAKRWLLKLIREVDLPDVQPGGLLLSKALSIYQSHAKRTMNDPATLRRAERAIEFAESVHGTTPANDFRGRALRDVRDAMRADGSLSRGYINSLIRSLKTAFTWLVAEELVPPDVLAALRAVRALAAGEGGKERDLPAPADESTVTRTLPECSPTIAAMVRLQQRTGMRPGEVCRMRRQDVSTSPDTPIAVPGSARTVAAVVVDGVTIWMYVPPRHKNSHRGKPRVVPIGPEAQAILAPWLMKREPHEYLFQPAEMAVGKRGGGMIRPGECYTAASYSRAVARAAKRAGVALQVYALRRAAAEHAAEVMDAESAAAMLGHSASRRSLDAYVNLTAGRAAQVAAKVG